MSAQLPQVVDLGTEGQHLEVSLGDPSYDFLAVVDGVTGWYADVSVNRHRT